MMAAIHRDMKVLQEYGRLLLVYMSFAGFLVAEVVAIYSLYRYLGMI